MSLEYGPPRPALTRYDCEEPNEVPDNAPILGSEFVKYSDYFDQLEEILKYDHVIERKEFEAYSELNLDRNTTSTLKDEDGEPLYLHLPARSAWRAWRASAKTRTRRLSHLYRVPHAIKDD